jgi:hypothetical protein
MSNNFSKVKAKCMEAIRNNPGIMQFELYRMGIGHRGDIVHRIFSLCFEGAVVRIHDDVTNSYRLYPKGKEPQTYHKEKAFKRSLFQRSAEPEINKGHGDKFYMAFDESFGLLYIDLKILGMSARLLL